MHARWEETPFACLTLSLVLGIIAASRIHEYSFAAFSLSTLAFIAAASVAFLRNRLTAAFSCGVAALALGGMLLALSERDAFPSTDLRNLVARSILPTSVPALLECTVLEDGTQNGPDFVASVDVHLIFHDPDWVRATGRIQVRIAAPEDGSEVAALAYGNRIRAWAACELPRNFRNPGSPDRVAMLDRKGIRLLARIKSPRLIEILPQASGTRWGRVVASTKRILRMNYRKLSAAGYARQAAVLASIVAGETSELPAEIRTDFQNAGTYHILVVSGLHVSCIAWALIQLLQLARTPTFISRPIAAACILFFTSLVGFQASITRALWMFTLYLVGQSLFRRISPANLVFACSFLLLSFHPGWFWDLGFQLSFLSVAAIALTGMVIIQNHVHPLMNPLRAAGLPDRIFTKPGAADALGRRLRMILETGCEACGDRLGSWIERTLLRGIRAMAYLLDSIAVTIAISISVQFWLEPILAFYFNRLSWIAPISNLAVVPLSSLVLALGMLGSLGAAATDMAWPLLLGSARSANLLIAVNSWFAGLPGAWQRCPTPSALWVASGLALILAWQLWDWRRKWIPYALAMLGIVSLSLAESGGIPASWSRYFPSAPRDARAQKPGTLGLAFLDVGQGDCIVIRFPDESVWLLDAGGLRLDPARNEDSSPFDIGEAVVSRFLWSRWTVKLDRVMLSHPHQDHAGGMVAVLRNFPANSFSYAAAGADPILANLLALASKNSLRTQQVQAGMEWMISGVAVRVLNPPAAGRVSNLNNTSTVLQIRYGGFSALLPGDLEETGENEMMKNAVGLPSILLKAAHHGSRNATSNRFLEEVKPRWAVISAGRNNPFGNPSPEMVARLLRHKARPLLTMDHGAIFFETDGVRYELTSYVMGKIEQGNLLGSP